MSTNQALVEQDTPRNWVYLDDGADVDALYGSILEMKTAPIYLTGRKAAQFAAAKQFRLPLPARPLPLD